MKIWTIIKAFFEKRPLLGNVLFYSLVFMTLYWTMSLYLQTSSGSAFFPACAVIAFMILDDIFKKDFEKLFAGVVLLIVGYIIIKSVWGDAIIALKISFALILLQAGINETIGSVGRILKKFSINDKSNGEKKRK